MDKIFNPFRLRSDLLTRKRVNNDSSDDAFLRASLLLEDFEGGHSHSHGHSHGHGHEAK